MKRLALITLLSVVACSAPKEEPDTDTTDTTNAGTTSTATSDTSTGPDSSPTSSSSSSYDAKGAGLGLHISSLTEEGITGCLVGFDAYVRKGDALELKPASPIAFACGG